MKKLFLILFSVAILTNAGYSQWTANFSSPQFGDLSSGSSKGKDVDKDGTGGCYVSGYALFPSTGNDIILVKYSSTGDTIWTRSFNGTANDDDQAMASIVDASGNIFVTGYATMTGKGKEIVLLKYSSSGNLLWSKTFGGSNADFEDRALGLCVDASLNCYITGFSTNDNNQSAATTLKYDASGNLMWSQVDSVNNLDSKGLGIAVDNAGNVYITGYSRTASGGNDILVVKYNSSGSKLWGKTLNGDASGDDQACAVAIDGSGNVYVAGYLTMNIATSNTDCALVKYNSSGTFQWKRTYNGTGNAEDKALGIAIDNVDGCIYTTGHSASTTNANDYITLKYTSAGTQVWASSYNGPGNGDDQAYSIAITHGLLNITTGIVVTGGSWGSNGNHDFATVKYLPATGSQISVSRYSNSSISDDQAVRMVVDDIFNRIFVTGSSILGDSPAASVMSTQMIINDNSSELNTNGDIPAKFSLYQNYPNPFNPSTNIKFDITNSSNVKLSVYDMTGRVVSVLVNQSLTAGSYTITFSMSNLSSGIYFYELNTGDHKEIKKMTLIK